MSNEDLDRQKQDISKEFEKLTGLDQEIKEAKNKDTLSMIVYYRDLTKDIEARRNQINDSTIQYIAVLIAMTGVVTAVRKDFAEYWYFFLLFLFMTQAIISLVIVLVYEMQNRYQYPFLKLPEYSNKWKWFYRGNPHILEIDRSIVPAASEVSKCQVPYLEGLKLFMENYRTETLDDEFIDNLQQLYLLQVHNYFKNQFYLSLVRIRLWSRWAGVGVLLVGIVIGLASG